MVRAGLAEELLEWDGKTTCYRQIPKSERERVVVSPRVAESDKAPVDTGSAAALTQKEVMAVAGTNFKHGRSRTACMTEEQRLRRINGRNGDRLPPEDLVERATAKLQAWAQIGPMLQGASKGTACL
jgi:hypothetical protein